MKIGKAWMPGINEIVRIVNVREDWSPYPYGTSGTKYNIYTLERENGDTFEYNEFEEGYKNPVISVERLEATNRCRIDRIAALELEIEKENRIIEKLKK